VGTIQTHPYQSLWQDAKSGSHSGGGHAGHDEVCSVVYPPIHPVPPANYLDVLHGWGQTWIWDDLNVTRGTDWIAQAISEHSLVAVMDGSYIKEHYHHFCLAAFMLECLQG
jgi:hypothetical protein